MYDNTALLAQDSRYGDARIHSRRATPRSWRGTGTSLQGNFPEWRGGAACGGAVLHPGGMAALLHHDYGLDMLAGYWIALDWAGRAYVYRELYESGLIMSEAARRIREATNEEIYAWPRPTSGTPGRTPGAAWRTPLSTASRWCGRKNNRVQGWLNLREWLPTVDETGAPSARLRVFRNCVNLIKSLPALQHDPQNPEDAATEPHQYTHAPDALRYFVAGRPGSCQWQSRRRG